MFESLDPVLFWFFLGLFLLLAEIFLPVFVIIFFGIGAWVTTLLFLFGLIESFNIQLVVFLVSSVRSGKDKLSKPKGHRPFGVPSDPVAHHISRSSGSPHF